MAPIRIATWNTKQGVAPRQKAPILWEWVTSTTKADLLVLTEARVTREGIPEWWSAIYTPGGVGGNRRYGTIIAARGLEIRRAEYRRTRKSSEYPSPATTFAAEVIVEGELELVVVGAYGLLNEAQNGYFELGRIIRELTDLVSEYGPDRLVVAGDFNLWPDNVLPVAEQLGLLDATGMRRSFPRLEDPLYGSRIWTHKNGRWDGNGRQQELDFILLSDDLADYASDIRGGVDDFPDAWRMSDHAPVAVTLRLP